MAREGKGNPYKRSGGGGAGRRFGDARSGRAVADHFLATETTSHDVRRAETADWALDARERRLEAARERARARREEQA